MLLSSSLYPSSTGPVAVLTMDVRRSFRPTVHPACSVADKLAAAPVARRVRQAEGREPTKGTLDATADRDHNADLLTGCCCCYCCFQRRLRSRPSFPRVRRPPVPGLWIAHAVLGSAQRRHSGGCRDSGLTDPRLKTRASLGRFD